eukprot:3014413-Amphidinium_carterae.1
MHHTGAPHSRMPPLGWSSWVALGKGPRSVLKSHGELEKKPLLHFVKVGDLVTVDFSLQVRRSDSDNARNA